MGFELFPFDIGEGLLQIAGDFAMPENLIFSAKLKNTLFGLCLVMLMLMMLNLTTMTVCKIRIRYTDDLYDGVIQD